MTLSKEQKLEAFRLMNLIRRFEERSAELYSEGEIGGFLHLYIGQEAVAIAANFAIKEDDNILTAYRDHGVALARGLSPKNVMAELLGRKDGVSKGKGGSMHLADKDRRYWGGYAVVGGHLPLAAGIALADKYREEDRITLCLLGDGATNIGYFHEALNLSALWELPVLWVIENNQYGMGTAVKRASAVVPIARKAEAFGMPCCFQVDGMDLIEMEKKFEDGVKHVRGGNGPYLIEAVTYRYKGHSMGDPERYRPTDEVEEVKEKEDPIDHLRAHLLSEDLATEDELDELAQAAYDEVEESVEFAKNSPMPEAEELYEYVYVE
jgi:pyruvate dehydrogenase E1 component alpha subunit